VLRFEVDYKVVVLMTGHALKEEIQRVLELEAENVVL
jgi:hypothetical protein